MIRKDKHILEIGHREYRPLFGSLDKFEFGTGWPSFTKPLEPENAVEKRIMAYSLKEQR